jgi:hypothetical protein
MRFISSEAFLRVIYPFIFVVPVTTFARDLVVITCYLYRLS